LETPKLQQYVLKVREGSGATLVMAAAKGLMLPNKQLLKEFGVAGHLAKYGLKIF